jgi:hypothetical protein
MPNSSEFFQQAIWPLLQTAAAIFALALIVAWIRSKWRDHDDPAAGRQDLLSEYREMQQRGELSDEEFRKIKSRMASRVAGSSPASRVGSAPSRGPAQLAQSTAPGLSANAQTGQMPPATVPGPPSCASECETSGKLPPT